MEPIPSSDVSRDQASLEMPMSPIPSNESQEEKPSQQSFSHDEPLPSSSYEYKIVYLRKAYAIFFIENLIITLSAMMSACLPHYQSFQRKNSIMPVLFFVFLVCFPIATMFCPKQMKSIPNNYILAVCYTVSSSYIVSYIGAITDPWLILLENETATLMILAFVILLTVLKNNFSAKIGFIVIVSISLFSFVCGHLYKFGFTSLLINFLIDIAFGVFYIYQILLCINEREFLYQQNEIIFGSFLPYTDLYYFPLKLCKLDKYTRME